MLFRATLLRRKDAPSFGMHLLKPSVYQPASGTFLAAAAAVQNLIHS
jgi:hypothetical protein